MSRCLGEFDILILGAGFAGIGFGSRLKAIGISNFGILEQSSRIGGVWRDNQYPGCACDVPSVHYSFSFHSDFLWQNEYGTQTEILRYLEDVVDKYKLNSHIRFNESVVQAHYLSDQKKWRVTNSSWDFYHSRILVTALGGLSHPAVPIINGIETFPGRAVHTARWPRELNIDNQDVVVIGTGASGIQIASAIAKTARSLHIVQRTPAWVFPKKNERQLSKYQIFMRKYLPFYRNLLRQISIRKLDRLQKAGLSPSSNKKILLNMSMVSTDYLNRTVKNPEVRRILHADYTNGCKRRVYSNDFYQLVNIEKIKVISNRINHIEGSSIVFENGMKVKADTIVFATGFRGLNVQGEITQSLIHYPNYVGLESRDLYRSWKENGASSFLGMCYENMPNFFTLIGPNTGLGSGSLIYMMESQFNYIIKSIQYMKSHSLSEFRLKPGVEVESAKINSLRFKNSIWNSDSCRSYYQGANGEISALWPGSANDYRKQTRRFEPNFFTFI